MEISSSADRVKSSARRLCIGSDQWKRESDYGFRECFFGGNGSCMNGCGVVEVTWRDDLTGKS